MLNLREINKFVRVPAGECLVLQRKETRAVRLEVNAAGPCRLLVQHGPDDIRFLADVAGRETIEMVAEGPIAIWPSCDDEVWMWTPELSSSAFVIEDAETFTKIAERQPRNPELERIAAKMAENVDKRMRQLEAGMRSRATALERENEALRKARDNGNGAAATDADASASESKPKRKPAEPGPKADDGGDDDSAAKD